MTDITTPEVARKIQDLTNTQIKVVRDALGINDFPFQPDKTYIVFDADIGDNYIYLATWNVRSYTITKGDGTQPVSYNDTGGTKTLNYTVAGRYIITIDGFFHGIIFTNNFTNVPQVERDKYIGIYVGSDGSRQLEHDYAFYKAENLEFAIFNLSGLLSTPYGFSLCTKLKVFEAISISEFSNNVFEGCTALKEVNTPMTGRMQQDCFNGCTALKNIDITGSSQLDAAVFDGCTKLNNLNLGSIPTIAANAFDNCTSLTNLFIDYSAGVSIAASSFTNVKLADLYVKGAANLTEAQAVETKLTTGGMVQLAGYRLLY